MQADKAQEGSLGLACADTPSQALYFALPHLLPMALGIYILENLVVELFWKYLGLQDTF